MSNKKKLKKVSIRGDHLLELIHWARRYADRRCTFVPLEFNRIYDEIMDKYPFLKEHEFHDKTLTSDGKFFPYAQDGMYNEKTGLFDSMKSIRKQA